MRACVPQLALAATSALDAAHQALALEALLALTCLRLLEGPPPHTPAPAPTAPPPSPAEGAKDGVPAAPGSGPGGKKKERGGGGGGLVLGKGTTLARAYLERAAAGEGAESLAVEGPGGPLGVGVDLGQAWRGVAVRARRGQCGTEPRN